MVSKVQDKPYSSLRSYSQHRRRTFEIEGSRCLRHRPMHCWSVRPGRARAMVAHWCPSSFTSSTSRASSSLVHLSRTMLGLTWIDNLTWSVYALPSVS